MTIHELKIWPAYFQDIVRQRKKAENRFNDRLFIVGDLLNLREWDFKTQEYTGRSCKARITHITDLGTLGPLLSGWVTLSITLLHPLDPEGQEKKPEWNRDWSFGGEGE